MSQSVNQLTSSAQRFAAYRAANYFPSLDGLRALSILSVVWYHVPELRPLWRTGFLGVHLFFAISGYLITTLLLRERRTTGGISLKRFYIRRTLRIFPAYYLTLALFYMACLVVPDMRGQVLETYRANLPSFLTYTSNWFVYPWGPGRVIFVAAWSLATEEQFYLFWPSIVKASRSWRVPVLVMLALIVGNELMKVQHGYQFFLSGQSLLVTILNSVSTAICFGSILAYALDNEAGYRALDRVLGRRWSAPLVMALMLAVSLIPDSDDLHVFRMFYICLVMALVVGAVVIREDHLLKPLLASRAAKAIGMISYGMYLFHPFGINAVDRLLSFVKAWPLLHFAAVALVTMAIAAISYVTYERIFLRLKDRFGRAG